MIHNETVNIWSHLIGMVVFIYLILHTFARYEPSDFYYSTLLHMNASADFGVLSNKLNPSYTVGHSGHHHEYFENLLHISKVGDHFAMDTEQHLQLEDENQCRV
mmetsp:Transcript_8473/g.12946  ORF Transcript_8473/g.12946 Transcript_8473/m.12946 type:complete len:104 (-) Transcript_8473:1297-1608(-)